jgi:hypothetical protein
VDQDEAQRLVQAYLTVVLGDGHDATSGSYRDGGWVFLIRSSHTDVKQPFVVGHIEYRASPAAA